MNRTAQYQGVYIPKADLTAKQENVFLKLKFWKYPLVIKVQINIEQSSRKGKEGRMGEERQECLLHRE